MNKGYFVNNIFFATLDTVAQLVAKSIRLGIERLLVRDSRQSLCCVLKQDALSAA